VINSDKVEIVSQQRNIDLKTQQPSLKR